MPARLSLEALAAIVPHPGGRLWARALQLMRVLERRDVGQLGIGDVCAELAEVACRPGSSDWKSPHFRVARRDDRASTFASPLNSILATDVLCNPPRASRTLALPARATHSSVVKLQHHLREHVIRRELILPLQHGGGEEHPAVHQQRIIARARVREEHDGVRAIESERLRRLVIADASLRDNTSMERHKIKSCTAGATCSPPRWA